MALYRDGIRVVGSEGDNENSPSMVDEPHMNSLHHRSGYVELLVQVGKDDHWLGIESLLLSKLRRHVFCCVRLPVQILLPMTGVNIALRDLEVLPNH